MYNSVIFSSFTELRSQDQIQFYNILIPRKDPSCPRKLIRIHTPHPKIRFANPLSGIIDLPLPDISYRWTHIMYGLSLSIWFGGFILENVVAGITRVLFFIAE